MHSIFVSQDCVLVVTTSRMVRTAGLGHTPQATAKTFVFSNICLRCGIVFEFLTISSSNAVTPLARLSPEQSVAHAINSIFVTYVRVRHYTGSISGTTSQADRTSLGLHADFEPEHGHNVSLYPRCECIFRKVPENCMGSKI